VLTLSCRRRRRRRNLEEEEEEEEEETEGPCFHQVENKKEAYPSSSR
jgi:hypothetical protein